MEREISITLAIVLEQRPSSNPWTDHVWQIVDILPGEDQPEGWREVPVPGDQAEGCRRFVYAPAELTLHRRLGEAYDHNMMTENPALWVMLDECTDRPVPYKLRGVTADPYEAAGFLDAAEGLIERLAMPVAVRSWMAEYMLQMPEPEQFKKRKRVPFKGEEEQKFGKEPIFSPDGRKLS